MAINRGDAAGTLGLAPDTEVLLRRADDRGPARPPPRSTDSTNERAKELALAGAPHGTLVTADEQTAGRGRQGRAWAAPPREALLMSLVLRRVEPTRCRWPPPWRSARRCPWRARSSGRTTSGTSAQARRHPRRGPRPRRAGPCSASASTSRPRSSRPSSPRSPPRCAWPARSSRPRPCCRELLARARTPARRAGRRGPRRLARARRAARRARPLGRRRGHRRRHRRVGRAARGHGGGPGGARRRRGAPAALSARAGRLSGVPLLG